MGELLAAGVVFYLMTHPTSRRMWHFPGRVSARLIRAGFRALLARRTAARRRSYSVSVAGPQRLGFYDPAVRPVEPGWMDRRLPAPDGEPGAR